MTNAANDNHSAINGNPNSNSDLCSVCLSPVPDNAKFCPKCGGRCDGGEAGTLNPVERDNTLPEPSQTEYPPSSNAKMKDIADAAKVGKAVEALAHPLPTGIGVLGVIDPYGCLASLALGLVLFLANPLRYLVAIVYHFKADARLKKGEIAEARRLVNQCHAVNGVLYAVFILAWIIAVSVYIQD